MQGFKNLLFLSLSDGCWIKEKKKGRKSPSRRRVCVAARSFGQEARASCGTALLWHLGAALRVNIFLDCQQEVKMWAGLIKLLIQCIEAFAICSVGQVFLKRHCRAALDFSVVSYGLKKWDFNQGEKKCCARSLPLTREDVKSIDQYLSLCLRCRNSSPLDQNFLA